MLLNALIFLDRLLGHHWHWFCAIVWDWQMARDVEDGTFPMPTPEDLASAMLMDGLED